jgi:hypothetical protein
MASSKLPSRINSSPSSDSTQQNSSSPKKKKTQKQRPKQNRLCPRRSSASPRSMHLQLLSRLTQALYPSERVRCKLALDELVSRADWKMLEAIGRVCIAYDPIRGGRRIAYIFYA